MKRTMVTKFLFLLLAVNLISSLPATGNNVFIGRNEITVIREILPTSDLQAFCGITIIVNFKQFSEPQFAFDGRVAFSLVADELSPSPKLFSYSVEKAQTVDSVEVDQDFNLRNGSGTRVPFSLAFKVHSDTGLIAINGRGSEDTQKVMLLASDPEGRLRKLWVATFPGGTNIFGDELAFDKDGSRIYIAHVGPAQGMSQISESGEGGIARQSLLERVVIAQPAIEQRAVPHLDVERISTPNDSLYLSLLRTEDGTTATTVGLPLATHPSIIFNEARNQALVLLDNQVLVYTPGEEHLDVEYSFTVNDNLAVRGLGFSPDGRYFIAYAGYVPVSSKRGENFYYSFDLDQKRMHELALEQSHFPVSNAMTFHQPTQILYVPLSSSLKIKKGCTRYDASLGGGRQIDAIKLNQDGSLSRSLTFDIPEQSPDGSRAYILRPEPYRIAISATGALGFVSLGSAHSPGGHILSFDTLTGGIVADRPVDKSFSSIHLFEQLGLFVSTDDTENLPLIKANTEPVVEKVIVKDNRTIIKGFNFLSGARVQINDEEISMANRTPNDPGREISINRGKKDFPRGQVFSVVVTNRDGLKSEPFTFSR